MNLKEFTDIVNTLLLSIAIFGGLSIIWSFITDNLSINTFIDDIIEWVVARIILWLLPILSVIRICLFLYSFSDIHINITIGG